MRLRRSAAAWHTNVALLFLGAAMVLLSHQLVSESHRFSIGYSGVAGCSVIIYAISVLIILTQPVDRVTFPVILLVAIGCRLSPLLTAPFLSSDVYRYVWDGVVQHAHISPYRYVPGDPALVFLQAPHQDIFAHINRRDYAVTIYPPGAQALFYLVASVRSTVTAMKLAMVLFEGITLYALAELLYELGYRREQLLLYAWCPLLIWEVAGAGHLDSAAMAFIVLALLARSRNQPVATGLLLGVAVMIKMYPLVLFPALFQRRDYRMPAALCAVIVLGYACYASVGTRVFGFLGGYVKEEGIEDGTRYFLLELARHAPGLDRLPAPVYLAGGGMVFAILCTWCWNTCCGPQQAIEEELQSKPRGKSDTQDFLKPAIALGLALMLLFSPHYPWYVAWLVPLLALRPSFTVFTYLCAMFYLCSTALATGRGPSQFLLNEILYGSVLLACLLDIVLRRWPLHDSVFRFARVDRRSSALAHTGPDA